MRTFQVTLNKTSGGPNLPYRITVNQSASSQGEAANVAKQQNPHYQNVSSARAIS